MEVHTNQRNMSVASFLFLLVFSVFMSIVAIPNSNAADINKDVSVMYAGSLVKIMEQVVAPSFHNQTGYNFIGEGKGSVQISNMIIDGFRRPDVFISADTLPVEKIMKNNPPLAEWLVKFASAELVIAYNPNSPFAPELERASKGDIPWYKVLVENGFKFGRTDPELDPKGYYTVIAAKLANIYYNDSTIKDKILGADKNPEQIYPEEVLMSILDTGQIDAIAAYKHEAVSKGLPYITLPLKINLGDSNNSNFYNQASYNLHSNQTIIGNPIYFSYTIPSTVRNTDGAIALANYLISIQGKIVLSQVGLNPVKAVVVGDSNVLPPAIKAMIR